MNYVGNGIVLVNTTTGDTLQEVVAEHNVVCSLGSEGESFCDSRSS